MSTEHAISRADPIIGQSVPRKEDRRLLTGRGCFVEDISLSNLAHVAFVRSPHAHASVAEVDVERAREMPGVIGVVTSETWPELSFPLPTFPRTINAAPYRHEIADPPTPSIPILGRHVTHVGEIVAAVIAEDRYAAADAVDRVEVNYAPLPVVTWEAAVQSDAPQVHDGYDNVVARMRYAVGDVEGAFDGAELILDKILDMPSQKSMALECRGVLAEWDPSIPVLNVWSTVAAPYFFRDAACKILDLPPEQVRIMSRDIGGNFGLKGRLKPEDLIVILAARKLGRPVRWIETRLEHMTASPQNGRQRHEVRVGATRDGEIQVIDLKLQKEVGAYNHFSTLLPVNTINHLTTQYKVPAVRFETESIATNTVPCAPYRGAGRIEAVFTMDRILDAVARALAQDPLTIRLKNLVRLSDLPYRSGLIYRNGLPITYTNHNFEKLLDVAAARIDYWKWRDEQARLRKCGRAIGIGISSYVDAGGIGPSETATIRIDGRGRVTVFVGVNSQGQSHETTLAQVCAGVLNIPLESVTIIGGDTHAQHIGFGTGASRVAINAGNAIYEASRAVKAKILSLASAVFDCDVSDAEIVEGIIRVKPPRQQFIALGDLAQIALRDPRMSDLGGPGLTSTSSFYPADVVWSCGVNMIVVEIDRASGAIKVLKNVFVHDCGEPLNPAVVDGQVVGGIAQGLSIGMGEQMNYNEEGQPVSGSFMDYFVPRAMDMPDVTVEHCVFPASENPLGIKSVGESGPSSPAAAFAAAVEDALEGNFEVTRLPVSWSDVLMTLKAQDDEWGQSGKSGDEEVAPARL